MEFQKYIRAINDYPIKGVIFRDISPILENPKVFKLATKKLAKFAKKQKADVIAGIDSRGFIFGTAIAYQISKPFVMIRKQNKLPGKKIQAIYKMEYGKSIMELHVDAIKKNQRVLIVDDLLASGGTTEAAITLVKKLEGKIVGLAYLMDINIKGSKERLKNYPIYTLIKY